MRLYTITNPVDLECAYVVPIGEIGYTKCGECNSYTSFPKPAKRIVEWAEGSSQICSFVWTSRLIAEVLVTHDVREALRDTGAMFLPVEFYQDSQLKRPEKIAKRSKPRVWLPYDGPPLFSLWATKWVNVDLDRSSIRLVHTCRSCGLRKYTPEGIEVRKKRWDAARKCLVQVNTPRVEGMGVYVHQQNLHTDGIFRLYQLPGLLFCSERVKETIMAKRFSNVQMMEVGETF